MIKPASLPPTSLLLFSLALGLGACTKSTSAPTTAPIAQTPTELPDESQPDQSELPPEPGQSGQVQVASVQLMRACPKATADRKRAPSSGFAADMASCGESTLQLFVGELSADTTMTITSVHLLLEGNDVATPLDTFEPQIWDNEKGYQAWDLALKAGDGGQVSFKLKPGEGANFPDQLQERKDMTLQVVVSTGGEPQTLQYAVPSILDRDMVVT